MPLFFGDFWDYPVPIECYLLQRSDLTVRCGQSLLTRNPHQPYTGAPADITSLWVCGDKGQLLGCNVSVESNQKPFRRISAPASDKPVFASSMVHMRMSHSGSQNFPVAATFLLVLRTPPLFVSCLAFIFAFLCCFLLLGMEVEKESARRSRILPFVHIHGPALLLPSQRKRWGPVFGTASALAQLIVGAASNFVSTAANRAWSEFRKWNHHKTRQRITSHSMRIVLQVLKPESRSNPSLPVTYLTLFHHFLVPIIQVWHILGMPTLRQSNMAIENHHLRIVFPFEKVLMHNWSSSQPRLMSTRWYPNIPNNIPFTIWLWLTVCHGKSTHF